MPKPLLGDHQKRICLESGWHYRSLWQDMEIGPYAFRVLDLNHPAVEAAILDEMDAGINVYYDRR
jgi:hypothetical protein